MADVLRTPYLHLALDGDSDTNRNWERIDARLMDLALRLVDQVIGTGFIQQYMLAKPSVGTPELFDASVTPAKLAPGTLTWTPGNPGFIQPIDPTVGIALTLGKSLVFSLTQAAPAPALASTVQGALSLTAAAGQNLALASGTTGAALTLWPTAIQATKDIVIQSGGLLVGAWGQPSPTAGALQVLNGELQVYTPAGIWAPLPGTGGGGGSIPTGPASGDLAGLYPSPTVKYLGGNQNPPANSLVYVNTTQALANIVANATATRMYLGSNSNAAPVYSQIQYSELAGTPTIPTTLPPTGPAGGDLKNTYPTPAIGIVQGSKIEFLAADVMMHAAAAGLIVGANDLNSGQHTSASSNWRMNLLPFGGIDAAQFSRIPPGGTSGQEVVLFSVAAAGTVRVTTDPVAALDLATKQYVDAHTGTGGPPSGTAGGDLGGAYPTPTVVKSTPTAGFGIYAAQANPVFNFQFPTNAALLTLARPGVGIVKSRVQQATNEKLYITTNMDAGGNAFDDGTQPSWGLRWGDKISDIFAIERAPASSLVWADLFQVDGTGHTIIPGTVASGGSVDQSQLVLGTRTQKARLAALPGLDWVGLIRNARFNGTAWAQDDATQPSWMQYLYGESLVTARIPAGSVTPTNLAVLDNVGRLTLNNDAAVGANLVLNPSTLGPGRTRLQGHFSAPQCNLTVNRDWLNGNAQDDATRSSWGFQMRADTDQALIQRCAPGTPATQQSIATFDGPTGKTTLVLADGTVNIAAIAPGQTVRAFQQVSLASGQNPGTGWITIGTAPVIACRGGVMLVIVAWTGTVLTTSTSTTFWVGVFRNGAIAVQCSMGVSGSLGTPPMPAISWMGQPGAGNQTFSFGYYNATANGVVSGSGGALYVVEFS